MRFSIQQASRSAAEKTKTHEDPEGSVAASNCQVKQIDDNKSKEQVESERQQVTMNDHQNSLPSSSIKLWLASLCPHGSHYSKKALRFFTSAAF